MKHRSNKLFIFIIAALFFSASTAVAGEKITLLLDWFINPDHGPLIVALEKGYFAEHSTPKRYLQSNVDLLQAQVLPFPPKGFAGAVPSAGIHESAVITGPVTIAQGVEIGADCQIGPNVVIGQGAKVAEGSTLSECVVWRDTVVSGNHQRCIITTQGVLQADGGDEVDS